MLRFLSKFTTTILGLILLLQFTFASESFAANEVYQAFTPSELGLMFLDPKGTTESADQQLDSLFSSTQYLISDLPLGIDTLAQPLLDNVNQLRDQIMGLAMGQSSSLQPFLKPYQLLEKDPLRYEQIKLPGKYDLQLLVEQSNDILKKSWRVSESIKLSDMLLPRLEKDLSKLKSGDPYQKSALGIISVSLINLNLGASQSAQKISPELMALQERVTQRYQQTQDAIQSNPMNAFGMAEDVQVLMSLSTTLSHVSNQLIDSGKKTPAILSSLKNISSQLIALK